jgi:hypothetical protein
MFQSWPTLLCQDNASLPLISSWARVSCATIGHPAQAQPLALAPKGFEVAILVQAWQITHYSLY